MRSQWPLDHAERSAGPRSPAIRPPTCRNRHPRMGTIPEPTIPLREPEDRGPYPQPLGHSMAERSQSHWAERCQGNPSPALRHPSTAGESPERRTGRNSNFRKPSPDRLISPTPPPRRPAFRYGSPGVGSWHDCTRWRESETSRGLRASSEPPSPCPSPPLRGARGNNRPRSGQRGRGGAGVETAAHSIAEGGIQTIAEGGIQTSRSATLNFATDCCLGSSPEGGISLPGSVRSVRPRLHSWRARPARRATHHAPVRAGKHVSASGLKGRFWVPDRWLTPPAKMCRPPA